MTRKTQWLPLLKERFGFDAFREGQLEALEALENQRRILCILPTGRGKSLLYQFPSLLLPGMTLVISPLLALMRDQVAQLKNRFSIAAGSLNSDQTLEENEIVRNQAIQGALKILFVSPEQLDMIEKCAFLESLPISLVVIDEAHCISTWGHDFRPSYRQIVRLLHRLKEKNPRVLGLTATADARTERDIQTQIEAVKVLRESLDRPNLTLSVLPARGLGAKLLLTRQLLAQGTTLIYCATRENCELVAEYLLKNGIQAIAYHAGLDPEKKREIQSAFLQDQYQAIAATNALGMGIDKPNIRTILHFDIPGSITAYYQEVGRAGRDGLPAKGILIYDWVDKKIQEYFISSAMPEKQDFDAIRGLDGLSLSEIKQKTGLHPTRVQLIIAELVEQGFLQKELKGKSQIYCKVDKKGILDLSRYDNQFQVKTGELRKMTRYAESSKMGCRMQMLRQNLGDAASDVCGQCDLCKPEAAGALDRDAAAEIDAWLQQKPVPIAEMKMARLQEGIALLDGKLRSPLFVRFMKTRQEAETLDPEIFALCKHHLKPGTYAAIIPIPSTTWRTRIAAAQELATYLHAPLLDLLSWNEVPEKRQGELLNNDQRAINVQGKMVAKGILPDGPILLFDDYIGSGATMREAARALRLLVKNPTLIPFTIAAVKWRLGAPGFV